MISDFNSGIHDGGDRTVALRFALSAAWIRAVSIVAGMDGLAAAGRGVAVAARACASPAASSWLRAMTVIVHVHHPGDLHLPDGCAPP